MGIFNRTKQTTYTAAQVIEQLKSELKQTKDECQELHDRLAKYESSKAEKELIKTISPQLAINSAGGYKIESVRGIGLPDSTYHNRISCYLVTLDVPYPVSCLQEYNGIQKTVEKIKDDLINGGIFVLFSIGGYIENRDNFIYHFEDGEYDDNGETHYIDAIAHDISIDCYCYDGFSNSEKSYLDIKCSFIVRGAFSLPICLPEFITKKQEELGAVGEKKKYIERRFANFDNDRTKQNYDGSKSIVAVREYLAKQRADEEEQRARADEQRAREELAEEEMRNSEIERAKRDAEREQLINDAKYKVNSEDFISILSRGAKNDQDIKETESDSSDETSKNSWLFE